MGFLRFLLAFAVVIAHSAPFYGFVGIGGSAVPAFFIISGFYMNLVLSTKYLHVQNGVRQFYFNRFLRLFPMYWATLALFIFLAMIPQSGNVLFFDRLVSVAHDGVSNALDGSIPSLWASIPNLFMVGSDVLRIFTFSLENQQMMLMDRSMVNPAEFVDMSAYLIVDPIWSLGVELVCYLAAPFLSKLKTILLLICFLAAIYIQGIWVEGSTLAWFHLPFWYNAPYFIVGMLAYRFFGLINQLPVSVRICLAIIPFIVWAFYPSLTSFFKGQWYVWLPYSMTIPALFSLTKNSVLDRKLGDLSYPVYIVHTLFTWPVINFGSSAALVAMVVSCIASSLLINLIDEPISKFKKQVL